MVEQVQRIQTISRGESIERIMDTARPRFTAVPAAITHVHVRAINFYSHNDDEKKRIPLRALRMTDIKSLSVVAAMCDQCRLQTKRPGDTVIS